MRKTSEILADALNEFDGGKRWMKGALVSKRYVKEEDESFKTALVESEKFCALGAICRSMAKHGELVGHPVLLFGGWGAFQERFGRVMVGSDSPKSIVTVNDSAISFEPVKEMFCRGIKNAIAEEEKEEVLSGSETTLP